MPKQYRLCLIRLKANHFAGKYFIQMGTIAPEESRELEKYIHQRRGFYLECPVLGSLPEARTGTLILMAAGEKMTYQACLPVLNLLVRTHNFSAHQDSQQQLNLL